MKTSELTGAALDWAVAKCEGVNPAAVAGLGRVCFAMDNGKGFEIRNYSTDWSQAGPIIEREKMGVIPNKDHWTAIRDRVGAIDGPTYLIAAMRCYVASKLGDEVEIPKELL